jgi:hypothetical protein
MNFFLKRQATTAQRRKEEKISFSFAFNQRGLA